MPFAENDWRQDANELEPLHINNRRYLGNKYKLLGAIRAIVREHCPGAESFADIFAGTGAVASAFTDMRLTVNDLLHCNTVCHEAWFSGEAWSRDKVAALVRRYNAWTPTEENYVSENFADTYFSRSVCRKIGAIREDIEVRFATGEINRRERALLVASLLYAMDRIANTCGHYDAFRKTVDFRGELRLRLPNPPPVRPDNVIVSEDANTLAKRLVADIVFMDQPYNSRQYSDAYHVLENIARWEKPPVQGVARKMDRSALKSDYCTGKAPQAFAELVRSLRAKYLILTYNNMGEKGNERSNAKLSDDDILAALREKGDVQIFNIAHKAFTAGKSSHADNAERIFLCTCHHEPLVASPLNYTGGKFRILPQLSPHFPTRCRTFVDLFCGGFNVGANVVAERVIGRDACVPLIDLLKTLQTTPEENVVQMLRELLAWFGFSDSATRGYAAYGCDSNTGLGTFNQTPYSRLRTHYATLQKGTPEKAIALYALIVHAFNNQIRFNAQGAFNLPVGKRDFNACMERKLRAFVRRLHERAFTFEAGDFRDFDVSPLGIGDFVYADPPYLVTTASYNENGGWTTRDEADLLALLERLHAQGCRFALSNVTEANNRRNDLLCDWIERHADTLRVVEIARDYSNANYRRKAANDAREVLILNKV